MKRSTFFCVLSFFVSGAVAQSSPTFVDVAPIIHKNCTPCHRPNEAAPFSLISYEDVAKRASFIKDVISTGYMPPWKANDHYVSYANKRGLSQKEKDVIIRWIDAKAPKGAYKEVALKESAQHTTGINRRPDLTISTPVAYTLPGDNLERFVVFKVPFELPDSANVEAIEFTSNNKKLVHHVNYAVHEVPAGIDIRSGPNMINLTEDDRSKVEAYTPFKKTITYYGGWIPGASGERYPKGFGWVMPRRGVVLITVHFAPSAKEEESISGINLFFTKTPVARKIKVISFGSGGIGEKQIMPPLMLMPNTVKTFRLRVANPGEDFSVMYVWPHMHLLGKSFLAYGITPYGDTIRLSHIPDWDFRWQEIYKFKNLIRIPRGTTLHIEGTYDNTAANPFNPSRPPRFVMSSGDMRSADEMLTLMMIFLPYKEGDEAIALE